MWFRVRRLAELVPEVAECGDIEQALGLGQAGLHPGVMGS
jgi:hypothetical protein